MSDDESRGTDSPVSTGSTPALCRRFGGYVGPDAVEQRGEAIDRTEARNRQRVLGNVNRGGR